MRGRFFVAAPARLPRMCSEPVLLPVLPASIPSLLYVLLIGWRLERHCWRCRTQFLGIVGVVAGFRSGHGVLGRLRCVSMTPWTVQANRTSGFGKTGRSGRCNIDLLDLFPALPKQIGAVWRPLEDIRERCSYTPGFVIEMRLLYWFHRGN